MFQNKVRDFQSVYKRNANYQEKRIIRASVKGKERRESRLRNFDRQRNIDDDIRSLTDDVKENTLVNNDRLQKLKQWKTTRELLKLSEMQRKAKEKPPFKCGFVHHKPFPVELPTLPTLRRSTRNGKPDDSKVKSFAPKLHVFKPPSNVVSMELVTESNKKLQKSRTLKETPFQRIVQDNSIQSIREKAVSKTQTQSVKPNKSELKQFKVPNRFSSQPRRSARLSSHIVPDSGKSRKKDESTNNTNLPQIMENSFSPGNEEHTNASDDGSALSFIYPADLSPFISKVRGSGKKTPSSITKSSSDSIASTSAKGSTGLRKQIGVKLIEKILNNPDEIKMEESKYLSSKEGSTPKSCGKASSVKHFRDLYSEAVGRLNSECLKWDKLLLSEDIPVDVLDSIRTTVGVTRLLIREKLAQFKGLVDECENCMGNSKTTGQTITPTDLQGFWELVLIQVNDVDSRFSELQIIKDNNWVEVKQTPVKIEERKLRARNKITFKTKKPIEKKSGFKAFMQEQKKKLLAEKREEQMPTVTSPCETKSDVAKTPSKLNTSIRSILKSGRRRKSSKMSITANTSINEAATPPMEMTPRKVTFKGEVVEGSHGMKVRLTPHSNGLKGNTRNMHNSLSPMTESQPCTPMPNGDLICWDSPYQDVTQRRSPRLKTNK